MADDCIIYDRDILYDEVWAEPMRDVARRYGISDVALAKTCRKLGVPVPGRGYWAKVKAGKADARPPLSALEEGQSGCIVVRRWAARQGPQPLAGLEDAVPIAVAEPIVVAETLENPHKLVALSARYLMKAHPRDGLVSAPRRSCLDIQVAPESLDRALRICDALIKAMETAGLPVDIAIVEEAEPERPSYYDRTEREPHAPARVTRVLCNDEWIEFCLSEKTKRIEGPAPTPSDKGGYTWAPRVYAWEPTGELTLQLTNVEGLGVRAKWQDGKRQRLEQCLGSFVAHLSTVALAFKLKRDADAQRAIAAREAELRRLEESRLRYQAEERRRQEEKREQQLEAEVALWRRAEDIRAYVQATLKILGDGDAVTADDKSARERMKWALEYADRIDPLPQEEARPPRHGKNGPPSLG